MANSKNKIITISLCFFISGQCSKDALRTKFFCMLINKPHEWLNCFFVKNVNAFFSVPLGRNKTTVFKPSEIMGHIALLKASFLNDL